MHDLSAFTMITNDSRAVKAGAIFAALPGVISDGRSYIDAAIKSGATYVLAPIGTQKPQADIIWQESADIRRDYALLCAAYYSAQPEHIIAVTGTNGKSSVVSFARQLWGEESVSLGTIGLQGAGMDEPAALTTLDPAVLHEILARCAKNGVKKLALEASSHGLEQERLAGVKIKAAAFTNISHDHLDYHKTMDVYLQAKLRIFDQMEAGAPAVINADLPQSAEIIAYAEARGLKVLTFGMQAKTLKIIEAQPVFNGINAIIEVNGQRKEFLLPLLGSFQLYNALAALALSYPEALLEHIDRLQDLTPVHGRMDKIEGHPKGAQVFVDYAHTPDALETVLKALKPHVVEGGRLIALIGCGGDRDNAKRAPMARISGALADHVIVTDDNPRSEDPALIRKDVLAGFPAAEEIGGRGLAIKAAVKMLNAKDILLVAGKGHEQGQTIGTTVTPFDDSNEVIKAYKEAKI